MGRSKSRRPSVNRHRRRMWAMQAVLLIALGAVAARIEYVQHVFGKQLLKDASQVQNTQEVLLAPRGALLDATGHRLAYDVPAFFLDINVHAFDNLTGLSTLLAAPLGVPQEQMLTFLQARSSGWARWTKPVFEPTRETIEEILSSQYKDAQGKSVDHSQDVTFTPTEQRFYPYGTFGANMLGYVDRSGKGQSGLEEQYDSILKGKDGTVQFTRDGRGFPIESTMQVTKAAKPGEDIRLTIDNTIQGFVESQMDQLVKQYHPDHAAIVVTNPSTGAVLAMSSRPTYDPNVYWTGSTEALSNNWAVNDAFEPGSTFKVLTFAAGLATHAITLDQTFMSGHLQVANRTIYDWKTTGWGRLNFQQAMEYSSNVGFATVALKLGWSNLLQYMQAFGYLNKTGIDLPSEASSIVFPPASQHKVQLATTGFGQGIAVTPMQQMAAVGAIANGGRLMRPYIAQAFLDPNTGKVLRTVQPTVVNPQVASPDVIQKVQQTLVLDVSKGIDAEGIIPGYDVAGKTGTAQVVGPNGQYYSDRFIVSFIGYAPGWDPKVEVYVTLYWPKTQAGNQWGSTIATPAAREILRECMEYYHIAPQGGATSMAKPVSLAAALVHYVQTPNLAGQSAASAENTLRKLGLTPVVVGTNGTVQNQWPAAGVQESQGAKVYLWTASSKTGSLVMPDLTGLSLRDVGNMFAAMGLVLSAQGDGYASKQSIPAGKPVLPGATVDVTFTPPPDPVAVATAKIAGTAGG